MIPTLYALSRTKQLYNRKCEEAGYDPNLPLMKSTAEHGEFYDTFKMALAELQRASFTTTFEDGLRLFEGIAPFTISGEEREEAINDLRIVFDSTKDEVNGRIYSEVADIISGDKTTKKDKLAAATVLAELMNLDKKAEGESKGLSDKLIVSLINNADDKKR